ncbi:hypothetical protein Pcinc_018859 [Petrolisthes cinctipes]|uniref:Uncharacterized protein n=1 Tax=Petrolisthes cinctipes TaxID=88211 RepID=A0AAE1FR67_PETCI|nr:hypothetical protein Pcinc_018859 [Petrolisthes cinctipes]
MSGVTAEYSLMVLVTLPSPPLPTLSLCITLQWSRRDGHTINLPWSLLTDLLDDPFEDAELEALSLSDLAVTWSALWHHFLFTVLGCQPLPTTTANILHVLASVTVSGLG